MLNNTRKYILTSRQIKRRNLTAVAYWDNGWRYGYLTKVGRKWATGRKAATGSPLKLALSEKGKDWKEIRI